VSIDSHADVYVAIGETPTEYHHMQEVPGSGPGCDHSRASDKVLGGVQGTGFRSKG
jgi:hypothetical protein